MEYYDNRFNSKKISISTRNIKPDIIISVDSIADDDNWKIQGADSVAWANNSLIDLIFHMDYREKININHIEKAIDKLENKSKLIVLVANYEVSKNDPKKVKPRDSKKVTNLIETALNLSLYSKGVGLYAFEYLTKEQIVKLNSTFLKYDFFKLK